MKDVPCKKADAFSYLKWNYQWIRIELPQENRIERLKTDLCLCGYTSVRNRGTIRFDIGIICTLYGKNILEFKVLNVKRQNLKTFGRQCRSTQIPI